MLFFLHLMTAHGVVIGTLLVKEEGEWVCAASHDSRHQSLHLYPSYICRSFSFFSKLDDLIPLLSGFSLPLHLSVNAYV